MEENQNNSIKTIITTVSEPKKTEIKLIVNKIIELIKIKHLSN
jgi:hypothetical protein